MNNQVLIDNLRCIPDFPKKGINFRTTDNVNKAKNKELTFAT